MVENWVDWDATEQLQTKSPEELKLIEQLTRVLVYRSFGNPRDIIRELRLMQEWADTEQPYLTDRLSKSPALQIFAAIQDCVEKTAVPQQSTSVTPRDSDGSVALVSERLVGDEARLVQIRRGLYILTEELINRQTLTLDNRKPDSSTKEPVEQKTNGSALWQHQLEELLGKITKPTASSSEPTALAKIQQDNFSLLSVEDVRQLAKRLGGYLSLVHDNPDLFPTGEEWGQRRPLFLMQGVDQLRVTNDFYALTGRQALAANPESHGGTRYNIIPDEVNLQLTVRTYKEEVRKRILASIERIAKGVAMAAGIPDDRAPIVKASDTEITSSTYNDPQLTERVASAFRRALGDENVTQVAPIMASEDFGYLSLDHKIPSVIFWLGAVDPAKVKQSKETGIPLPSLHSSLFAPVPEPTLRTGVKAMTAAVLELMKK